MDSSARDNLANERTFLAYIRTALAFIGFGFVIARFAVFVREVALVEHQALPTQSVSVGFGVTMVCMGIAIAIFGAVRYAQERRALATGTSDGLPIASAITIVALLGIFGGIMAYLLYHF